MNLKEPRRLFSKGLSRLRQPGILASLLRGSATIMAIQILGSLLGYGLQISLARLMGSGDYGTYIYIFTWANIGVMFSSLGLRTALLRFIPEYKTQKDLPRLYGTIWGSLWLVVIASILLATVASFVVYYWPFQSALPELAAVMVGIWLIPLLTCQRLLITVCQSFRKLALAYSPDRVFRPLMLMAIAFSVYFLRREGQLSSLTVLILLAVVLAALITVQFGILSRTTFTHVERWSPKYDLKGLMRVSLPLLLVASFTRILKQTDVLMIGIFLGTTQVGLYNPAVRTAMLASFVLTAVSAAAAPMISSAYAEGNRVKLRRLMVRITQLVLLPATLTTLFLSIGAPWILGAFGPEFVAMKWVLVTLAIAQLIRATSGPVGFLLDLTGYQDVSARVRSGTAMLNIGLNLAGIHYLGVLGAAIATAISVAVERIWISRLVRQKIGIDVSFFSLLRVG